MNYEDHESLLVDGNNNVPNGNPNNNDHPPRPESPPDLEIADRDTQHDPVSSWLDSTLVEGATFDLPHDDHTHHNPIGGLPPQQPMQRGKAKGTGKKLPPAAQRKWLMIDSSAHASMVSLSRTELTQTLGVQLRDLRLLDPKLAASYPSAILCRERGLVVNLEYIKMIVGLDRVYITNLEDESATAFIGELQRRLADIAKGLPPSKSTIDFASAEAAHGSTAAAISGGSLFDEMPFELRVMEVALDVVSGYLERLTADLEAAAHPALDALTAKVSTDNLERVRRVKNRMVRLTTRVETLREVLEKFLDDDGDMRDMNLAAKVSREAQEKAVEALRHGSAPAPFDVTLPGTDTKTPGSPRSIALTYDSEEEEEEAVEEVEQLLESYFMQVDNTWNKLQTLTEYIDDTEDYINIQLDSQRNQLIRLDLMLTSFTASMGLITAITGLFAMNVVLSPKFQDKAPFSWFIAIAVTSAVVAVLLFSTVIGYSRYKRLI